MKIQRYILALALLIAGCSEKAQDRQITPYGKLPDDIRQLLQEELVRNELPNGTRPPPVVLNFQTLELNGVQLFRCSAPQLGALSASGFYLRSEKHNDYLVDSNGISIWLPCNILYFNGNEGELTCNFLDERELTLSEATSPKDVVEYWGTPYFIQPSDSSHHRTTITYYYEHPDYELLFFFDDTNSMNLTGVTICYGFHYLADVHTRTAMLGCTNSWPPWEDTNKLLHGTAESRADASPSAP
jgi:hypothetical protein